MSKSEDWKGKTIGLVLSGGGAKGAYQIGMFRALEELGLAEQIQVISGTSIGALNAIAYANKGVQGVRDILYGFEQGMSMLRRNASTEQIVKSRQAVKDGGVTIEEFVTGQEFYEFNSDLYLQEIQELLPDEILEICARKLYACAYSLNKKKPEYFCLNEMKPDEQRKIVLASSSLPFVFPAVFHNGEYYLDGGVVPAVCRPDGEKADKIPLRPILKEKLDAILVCFLMPTDAVDASDVPESTVYAELKPSRPLEAYPGEGTLDFTKEKLLSHEKLGYEDTMKLFGEN